VLFVDVATTVAVGHVAVLEKAWMSLAKEHPEGIVALTLIRPDVSVPPYAVTAKFRETLSKRVDIVVKGNAFICGGAGSWLLWHEPVSAA